MSATLDQLITEATATAARLTAILDKIESREVKPLQLEVGKRYVRRDGEVSGLIESWSGSDYQFKDSRTWSTYTKFGQFDVDDEKNQLDLITEYTEQAAPEPTPIKPEPVKTLRDEFAMAALAAIISKAPFAIAIPSDQGALNIITERVIGAYVYADVAMAVRGGKEGV